MRATGVQNLDKEGIEMLNLGKAEPGNKQLLFCYPPSKNLLRIFISWKTWEAAILFSLVSAFAKSPGRDPVRRMSKNLFGAGRSTQKGLSEHHGHHFYVLLQHRTVYGLRQRILRKELRGYIKAATEESKRVSYANFSPTPREPIPTQWCPQTVKFAGTKVADSANIGG